MIHTDEDDEFERIERENNLKGQPYYFDPTNNVISSDKNDPRFTKLGQLWPMDIKREWVGLTDEEYAELWGMKPDLLNFFRKIEAKLKEKNT